MEGSDPATRAGEDFYRFQLELLIANHETSGFIFREMD